MKKIFTLILVLAVFVGLFFGIKSEIDKQKEDSLSEIDDINEDLESNVGSEVEVLLNDDLKLNFYILSEENDEMVLLAKESLEEYTCDDEECNEVEDKLSDLTNSWDNASEIRLVKNSDILSEEDLQIESDSICTRLNSYLNPDKEGYFLENLSGKIGYVKMKDTSCVEIEFNSNLDKKYSIKPVITINKKYVKEV